MGFRTLEISRACEIHIRSGQMEIAYEEGSIQIPIEDLEQIMVHGAGIHHSSQLNAFNLADDLIEPYRAMVDLVAHEHIGSNVFLSKTERRELAHVLHNACMVDDAKVNIMTAVKL